MILSQEKAICFEKFLADVSFFCSDKSLSILSEVIPRAGSIFFVETSAATKLSPKISCGIESAAKHHPNNHIVSLN